MGIIDNLSAGFRTVAKHLWLITVPVLLDIALWLAPRLSVAPVVEDLVSNMRAAIERLGSSASGDATLRQLLESMETLLKETIGRTNLLTTLSWGRLGVPGIAGMRLIEPSVDRVIEIGSYGQWLGIEVGLLLVGLLITCVYLGMLGQQVRGEGVHLGALVKRVPTYWLYMLAVLLPLGALLFGVMGSSMLLGPLSFIFWALMLWILLYVSFTPQAITMTEERPLRAVAWRPASRLSD